MSNLDYFYIQHWTENEQNRDDERDVVSSDDGRFTIRDDVPIVEEDNNPHNGE
jgi:hypothetical protein